MHFNKRNLQKNTINDIIKEDKMSALTISPEEVKRVKGLGFLNNKGTDNFSARVLTVTPLNVNRGFHKICTKKHLTN